MKLFTLIHNSLFTMKTINFLKPLINITLLSNTRTDIPKYMKRVKWNWFPDKSQDSYFVTIKGPFISDTWYPSTIFNHLELKITLKNINMIILSYKSSNWKIATTTLCVLPYHENKMLDFFYIINFIIHIISAFFQGQNQNI